MNNYGRFAIALGSISAMVVLSCTENGVVERYVPDDGPASGFSRASEDAGAGRDATSGVASYCPSNRCPPGHATCASSLFYCDVDLLTDMDNCGECDNACPRNNSYQCVDGRCVLRCNPTVALDCDGIPDNGCETSVQSNDNCGSCGRVCPAGKECINRQGFQFTCGCMPGELDCRGIAYPPCVDPSIDDDNCGACGNVCPRDGDGSVEAPPNMRFGCRDDQCGRLKCDGGLVADCDGVEDNGCEISLLSDDNCGACGASCLDDEICVFGIGMAPMCLRLPCPEGMTFCAVGTMNYGGTDGLAASCRDLSSDVANCGACGTVCNSGASGVLKTVPICDFGRCDVSCSAGWGDCNGDDFDGCETNIESDPKNCGGCGIVCDGVAGQACVDGRCMVESCDDLQDAGGPLR